MNSGGMHRIRDHRRSGAQTLLARRGGARTRIRSGGVRVGRDVGISLGRKAPTRGVPCRVATLPSRTLGPCRRQLMAGIRIILLLSSLGRL